SSVRWGLVSASTPPARNVNLGRPSFGSLTSAGSQHSGGWSAHRRNGVSFYRGPLVGRSFMAFASMWKRRGRERRIHSNRRAGPGRRAVVPRLEHLEDRTVPSMFLVTNLNDSGPGSLRDAIASANLNPGADQIDFALGLQGTITLK